MKYFVLVILVIASFKNIQAQSENKNSVEIGFTSLTVNEFSKYNYSIPGLSPVNFFDGIFLRYTKNRIGFRFNANYENVREDNLLDENPPFFDNKGEINYQIGLGGQYNIFKSKNWIYTFADISYRFSESKSESYGGIVNSHSRHTFTTNGVNTFFGLGFTIKPIKHIIISPEIGYNAFNQCNKVTWESYINDSNGYRKSTDMSFEVLAKLQLAYKF